MTDFGGFRRGTPAEAAEAQRAWEAERAAEREAEERRRDSLPRTPESAELRARIAAERAEWTRHVEEGTLERETAWHAQLLEARRLEVETAEAAEARAYLVAVDQARATMTTALDVLADADAALSEALAEAELAEQQVHESERVVANAGRQLERSGHDKDAARRKVEADTALPHLRRRAEVCEATVEVRQKARAEALAFAREVRRDAVRLLGPETFEGVDLPPDLDQPRPSAREIARDRGIADYERRQRNRTLVEKVLDITPGVLR